MIGRCRRCRGEEGVFLILWVLLLTGLLTMVAIVIDLGALRSDRRIGRAAADAAATAGANDLPLGMTAACNAAWEYALVNLNLDPAAYSSTAPACGSVPPTCDPAVRNLWLGQAGPYTVRIVRPVPNLDVLLGADAVGGDIVQPKYDQTDGQPCDRIGVEISYKRTSTIGNISNETTVHSVARSTSSVGTGAEKPALVTLEQRDNCAVDAGSGRIHAVATGTQPALIYADSDGTGSDCSGGGDTVFEGGTGGEIWADPSPTGVPGELGYFAATEALAFATPPSYDQGGPAVPPVGANKVKLLERITRRPLDKIYHCGSVVPATPPVPGCTTGPSGTDHIDRMAVRYGNPSGRPFGFNEFPDTTLGQTCGSPLTLYPAGNWYINCTMFQVTSPVTFESGDIVFAGNVDIRADLTINSLNAADSTVVIRGKGGITTGSGGWKIDWSRTFVFMDNNTCPAVASDCGRLDISNGDPSRWTPPENGAGKDLIYWSESDEEHPVQGNPTFLWAGVFAAPRAAFRAQGNALVDATDVQLWVRKVRVPNASAELRLRADPTRSVSTSRTGSVLIR